MVEMYSVRKSFKQNKKKPQTAHKSVRHSFLRMSADIFVRKPGRMQRFRVEVMQLSLLKGRCSGLPGSGSEICFQEVF